MFRTHGRGPGFRNRAARQRARDRHHNARAFALADRELAQVPNGYAPMGIDAPFAFDAIVRSVSIAPAPPWYRRAWNSIAWFFRGLR